MKKTETKIKKQIRCKAIATPEKTIIKFPHQCIGNIALFLMVDTKKCTFEVGKAPKRIYAEKLLKQWELYLKGDELIVRKVK